MHFACILKKKASCKAPILSGEEPSPEVGLVVAEPDVTDILESGLGSPKVLRPQVIRGQEAQEEKL